MNRFTSFPWTEEKFALLEELRAKGLSAGNAAKELGITRNMAIGKMRRRGKSFMSQKPSGGGGKKRDRKASEALLSLRHPMDRPGAVTALRKISFLSRMRPETPSRPSIGALSFWQLEDRLPRLGGHCRWCTEGTVAREGSPDDTRRWCGDPIVEGSWCARHARIAAPQ